MEKGSRDYLRFILIKNKRLREIPCQELHEQGVVPLEGGLPERGQANKELSEASAWHTAVSHVLLTGEDSEGSPLQHVGGRLPGSLGR